jgi:stage V sporulation protein D (sporulation-specific penicillin-binding protein)
VKNDPRRRRAKRSDPSSRKMNAKMQRKLAGLFAAVVLVLICLAVRITYVNAVSGDQYAKQVLAQSQSQYSSTVLPFKRGDILDTKGTVLATSEKKYNVVLDCKVVNSDPDYAGPTMQALDDVFGLDQVGITSLLTDEKTKDSQYQVIKKDISVEEKNAFEEYCSGTDENPLTDKEKEERKYVKGVWFEEEYVRTYPLSSLACDVIGFTYGDNTADWGIEGYYSNTLNGVDGRKYGYWDSDSDLTQNIIDPVDGKTVVSTIDANIQSVVEKNIASFEEKYKNGPYSTTKGASNIGVIVMNPNDGSILAMGSSDPYDLNSPRDLSSFYTADEIKAMSNDQQLSALESIWKNYCISDTFEPGSVFKPVTMSSALEDGTIKGNETFYCDGGETVSGTYIKCSEEEGHGQETVSDVIRNSCNDAMMQIALKMGVSEFTKYQQLFNFGVKTGIDLSGEATGILYSSDTMGEIDLATSSFGQGFNCTMLQEAAAVSSVINGGNYYRPRVVEKILDSTGATIKTNDPVLLKQTISSDVSDLLRSYMKASVDNGTSVYAKVNGYSMGGKTGTAQKIPRGNGKYLVSWIGFVPYENPQVLIYVVIDEPNVQEQADSRFPQWMAKDILTEILPYLGIYPDEELTEEDPALQEPADAAAAEGTAVTDTTADTNVPTVQASADSQNVTSGNNEETDGYTNEEAGITN